MSDKLRNAAILPFLFAATGAPTVGLPKDTALALAPFANAEFAQPDASTAPHLSPDPVFVGPYRLLRSLGSGGMGVVYLAESTEPVQRRVALKLIHADSFSPALVEQFAVEKQALSSAEHDNVVRFFDAGTSDGRPWIAMEFIDGEPITDYCDRRELGIDARLRLFEDVCRAVEHLHARDVLHGDLKPANILVDERDGRAIPKIIDLGLARIGAHESGESDGLRGTLEYMAPEQFAMSAPARDERSDVYSLGVVLRELLVGPRPKFEQHGEVVDAASGATFDDDPTPSEHLQTLAGEAEMVARRRGTHASRLSRRLRRSLDHIAAQATARERDRRYTSAGELADAVAGAIERETRRSNHMRTAALVSGAAIVSFVGGMLAAVI